MEDIGNIARGCPSLEKDNPNVPACRKGSSCKLDVSNWLADLPFNPNDPDIVEVRFKNTRKGYYWNINNLPLEKGDLIAVEASPGHDIGVVSLTGDLVRHQLKKYRVSQKSDLPKIYRKAKSNDIEKWESAIVLEHSTMLITRKICEDLKLNMKIGDVEYQGDKTKAFFYYIADVRVDFRELIKILADRFRIRVEMRQIGARQEAGRIGGIGPCGRELCCSVFITNFVSVTTNSARYQELSLNPQKLAGQCGKLKCCLNYELDTYLDAQAGFPNTNIPLVTEKGTAYHFKTDVLRGIMWYSFEKDHPVNVTPVAVEKVKEIIDLNRKGVHPANLASPEVKSAPREPDYSGVIEEESLTRFDDRNRKKKKKKNWQNQQNRRNEEPKKS